MLKRLFILTLLLLVALTSLGARPIAFTNIADVADDTTPELGGDLSLNGHNITLLDGGSVTLSDGTNTFLTVTDVGTAADFVFPSNNDSVTPTIGFGDGDSGWYEYSDDEIRLSLAGSGVLIYGAALMRTATGNNAIMFEASTATNPVFVPSSDAGYDTGIGRAAEDQGSYVAGAKEAQRWVEYNDGVSKIANFLGLTQEDSEADGETNGTTLLQSDGAAGDDFITTCTVGDWVLVYGGTTVADYGVYRIASITDDNNLVLNTALAGTNSDVDFFVFSPDTSTVYSPSLDINGRLSSAPMTFAYTVAADITDPITSSVVLLDGDQDNTNEVVTLKDGATAGQIVYIHATADIDADDTCTVTVTTCTACPAVVFNKVGENATLVWTGTTWFVSSLQDAL